MKRIIAVTLLFSLACTAYAQEFQIKGKVISTNNSPVEFANVILKTHDSVFVTGGITDQRGRFEMDNIKTGKYNLEISSIGYETKNVALENLSRNTDMGNIVIDSTSILLDEVTVTASNIVNLMDKKVVLPTSRQINASKNGLSLIQQLQLSRITVDEIRKTVSVSGGENVQLRINGVEVSIQEVSALRPEDVLRVEYHDDPGLRYNNADAVIDIITRRRESGGFISLDTQNSPHVFFGNNHLTAKYNYKKSEFSVLYSGGYRSLKNMWRENTETFNFEDGSTLTRVEDGIPDKWAMHWDYMHLNYSYQENEKYFFNATARTNWNGNPKLYYRSYLYPLNEPDKGVHMTDRSSRREIIPSIDLYYHRYLKNKQTLIFNVVGTYISSDSDREYKEERDNIPLTDIVSDVHGDKYSIIGEGIYEKSFSTGKISAGLKHTQSVSDNEYIGNTIAETNMKQSETYAYTEYQGKAGKFNYAVGIGGTRVWFKQAGEGYTDYTFRPTLRLTYNFNENSFIRYRGNMYNTPPSLSDLSATEQLIDSLQLRRGNPNLRPVKTLINSFMYDTRYKLFRANFNVYHMYRRKPIMEQIVLEDNKFVRTTDNQRSWNRVNTELELKYGPIKDILTLSFATGIQYFDSKGNNYHHTYTNWFYRAEAMANYKNWVATFQIQNHRNYFYGETLSYGENFHILAVMYRHKQLTLGVMALNPFSDNWKSGSENRNAQAPSKNWQYIKESSRLFCISLSYNFSFGRKYQSGSKRLNNQDNESGVVSGSK